MAITYNEQDKTALHERKTKTDTRREVRFYVCLIMGFTLLVYGAVTPPPGHISQSIIIAAGIVFAIGAMCVGVDIRGIISDITKLREAEAKLLNGKRKE